MFCVNKEVDEAAKLKNQDEIKRFYLFSFHVYHLRDILKCSICLELYNCPIELSNCKHVFCKDCIENYMEYANKKELLCPICQKLIGSSSKQNHKFFERITTFVKHALQDVNIILGPDLNKLPSYSKTIELWEKNKDSSKIFTNIKTTTMLSPLVPDISAILKTKKVVIDANTKYVSSEKEGNTAFDVLASSPAQNPFFKQNDNKKYVNRKRESHKCNVDKLQNFENDTHKKDILNWLQDHRNKFDAIPSTQQLIKAEVPDFDLPSVSQKCVSQRRLRTSRTKKPNTIPRTERNSFVRDRCNTKEVRRTRSLECNEKRVTSKIALKRHSLATCPVNKELIIEQVSSEEDAVVATNSKKAVIVSLLEDSCLDAIDKEILCENKRVLNDSSKIDKKSSPQSIKHESSMDTSRGWNRINEIKKTIGNTKKKSRKLKVISRNSSTNIIDESNTNENRKQKRSKDLSTKILETDEECDTKCFDLNEVESYFSNNLSKIVSREHNDQPLGDKANRNNKIQSENVAVQEYPGTNIVEEISKKSDLESVLQHKELKDDSIYKCNDEIGDKGSSESENIIATSQDNENVRISKCTNVQINDRLEDKENSSNLQKINEGPQELQNMQEHNNVENISDDEYIFLKPTQEIHQDNTKAPDSLMKELLSLQNILIKEKDPETTLNKIREFLVDGREIIPSKCVGIQTEDPKEATTPFSNVSIQTILSHYKNVGIQTDSYDREQSTGFRISSTDMFFIQPVISSYVQTDCLICPNCKFDISESDKTISPDASQIITRTRKKIMLSGSFDNFNFETQDMIKGEGISARGLVATTCVSDKRIATNDVGKPCIPISSVPNQDKNIPSYISIDDDKVATIGIGSEASRVMSQTPTEVRSFKRARRLSSDNNFETDQLSQVTKKNKYTNDISVDFISEPDVDGDTNYVVRSDSQKLQSLNSDCVDYAEVLDNIMKKCEEDKSKIDRNVQNHLPLDDIRIEPVPKRLKTQDIIRECEQIIKEACSTTLRIEHTQCVQEPPKPLTLLEEFHQNFNNIDDNDVQSYSKSVHETKRKFSESLFTSTDNLKNCKDQSLTRTENLSNHNISKEKVDDFIHRFKELEDSFEEDYNAEVESITESMLKNHEQPQKVKILSNIVLEPINIQDVDTNVNCNRSAEIFDSDQEIIETTPQKNRPTSLEAVSLLSQVSKVKKKLSLENEDYTLLDHLSCFNKTFTPPPEFQDFIDNTDTENKNNDQEEKENRPQLSFLMSDTLENDIINARSKHNDFFITSTPFPSTSQVLSSRSLNLSPIHPSTKLMNPILAVQNASKLPLTITRSKTPPRQKITPISASTPKQKTILNYVKPGDNLNASLDKTAFLQFSQTSFVNTSTVNRKPIVGCTRLSKMELSTINSLANKKIITFTSTFSSMVTHMIVAVDKHNHLRDHTMKFVSAVAAGIWVVNIKWIEECLKQNKVISEEPYEALDISGVDGPRRSRLNRSRNPLFSNYVIYAAPPFTSTTQMEVENVIILLGGETVQRPDDLVRNKGKFCLIITESTGSQPDDIYETWLETLKVVTVDLEWLTRTVGKFEIQNLRPFTLCCEESIGDLSYPSVLLEDVQFSHNTLT